MQTNISQRIFSAVGQLGACALPVMLDSESKESYANWTFMKDKEKDVGVIKEILLSDINLIFHSGLITQHIVAKDLNEVLLRSSNGRLFIPTDAKIIFEDALFGLNAKIHKNTILIVYSLEVSQLKKYKLSNVKIRLLSKDDLPQAESLYKQDTKNIFSESHFRSTPYYGVFLNDNIVGACCQYGASQLMSSVLIGGFLTHINFRNKGIARALSSYVASHMSDKFKFISLHVEEENESAHSVYKSIGFRPVCNLIEIDFSIEKEIGNGNG